MRSSASAAPTGGWAVMRLALLSGVVWAGAVLQSVLPLTGVYHPNLPLMAALAGAWLIGSPGGTWLGFWAGWLSAATSGLFVGSFTFCYLIAGWSVGRVREAVYGEGSLLALPLVGLGTLFAELLFFLWNPRHIQSPLPMVIEAVLNLILAPFVVLPLAWLLRRWS